MKNLTELKIGDIVEHENGDEDTPDYVYGYIVGKIDDCDTYYVRWFDGHPETNHDIEYLRKVEKLDDISGR